VFFYLDERLKLEQCTEFVCIRGAIADMVSSEILNSLKLLLMKQLKW